MASLALLDVTKHYGAEAAVAGVSLEVADGELLAVLGPSGAGKSTLLRLIAGLERPDGGTVSIDGRDAAPVSPAKRGVAMIFQSFALFPHLSAAENIAFGLSVRGVPAEERRRRTRDVAGRLDIAGLLDRRPWQLSGGERQRVALARGLVSRPKALLLDEPLSNLDAQLRLELRAELRRVQEDTGLTVVHVTHDQSEALSLGDRVAVMRAGRIEQCDSPAAVYSGPASAWVAGFLGSPPMNLIRGRFNGGVLEASGLRLPVPAAVPATAGGELLAGIRPEHLHVEAGQTPANVEVIGRATVELDETTGHDRLVHLSAGELALIARVPAGPRRDRGEPVTLALERQHVHLFDASSGLALRQASP